MVSIDVSLILQIINFLFLIWILNIILYKPIRDALRQRNDTISGLERNIETLNTDSRGKDDAYASGIKEARAKGLKEKEILVQEAANEEDNIIQNINKRAQEDLVEVREKISKDVENVRESLQQELGSFADAIGAKILGRDIQ